MGTTFYTIKEITTITTEIAEELTSVWQASVEATHTFLTSEDVKALHPVVRSALGQVQHLLCANNTAGQAVAFIGVMGDKIEMLFVLPGNMGQGIGKMLLEYACRHFGARKVDVNEQNPEALKFYRRMGFKQIGRSPLDEQGKPFPILHLQLV